MYFLCLFCFNFKMFIFSFTLYKGGRERFLNEMKPNEHRNVIGIVGTGAPPYRKATISSSNTSPIIGPSTSQSNSSNNSISPNNDGHIASSSSSSSSSVNKNNSSHINLETSNNNNTSTNTGHLNDVLHHNTNKVWFTEKVKVHLYDPYIAVKQPSYLSFGSGTGGGLSLDSFLARRPRPTYTALSREGKEGILKVPAPFIRGGRKRVKRLKRKGKHQDYHVEDHQNSSNVSNSGDVNGVVDVTLSDMSKLENEEGGGMWQGLVQQWLKTTKGTTDNSFMLNRMMNNNQDNQEPHYYNSVNDQDGDTTSNTTSCTSGSRGGGNKHGSVHNDSGYESEGSTFSWMSDDSSRSNNSNFSRKSGELFSEDEDNNNDQNINHDETILNLNNDNGNHENSLKLEETNMLNRSDKWEKRRRDRDRWWQRVANLSVGNKETRENHHINHHHTNGDSVEKTKASRRSSGSDGDSTDTDGSDWAGESEEKTILLYLSFDIFCHLSLLLSLPLSISLLLSISLSVLMVVVILIY